MLLIPKLQEGESDGTPKTCMVTSLYVGWLQQTEGVGDIQRQVNEREVHQDGIWWEVHKLFKNNLPLFLFDIHGCFACMYVCASSDLRGKVGDRLSATVTNICELPYGW